MNVMKQSALCIAIVLLSLHWVGVACTGAPPESESTSETVQEAPNPQADAATGTEPATGTEQANNQEPPTQAEPSGKEPPVVPEKTPEPSCVPKKEECNGKDDDCNGQIDDIPARACYTGPQGTKDQGICKSGTQACEQGQWGTCTGEVLPGQDGTGACDGKDNNCDGKIDEGCGCKDGETQPCGSDEGVCEKGQQTCKGGQWGACTGGTKPQKETCNDKDDDCDGQVDEDFSNKGKSCTVGKGTCANTGSFACDKGGTTTICDAKASAPSKEVCNGKDDDCDGQTDEGLAPLTCGKGPCANSVSACTNGTPNTCQPKAGSSETCNGKDDDCDGTVDNGATCPSGQTCTQGKCTGGGTSTPYRTGTFQSPGNYTVVGTVSVHKTSSGERFDFSTNFSSSSGPDLYIYLVKASNGAATSNNFINLGKLKNTRGKQSYTLNQSSSGYKSIVVWCQRFGANFGYANFTP